HPPHFRQGREAARASQAGARGPRAVVQLWMDRRLSRRGKLPPALLEGIARAGELHDVRSARIQRALRALEAPAPGPRARGALRTDDEARDGLRAVEGGDLQGAEHR